MNTLKIIMILGIVSILTGCIQSLNPIYAEKDLIFKSELLGTWMGAEDTWMFEKQNDKVYRLTHSGNNTHATFQAHLIKIGKSFFLDLYPENIEPDDGLYAMCSHPVHTFFKIEIIDNRLIIEIFDASWLENGIEANQISIGHIKSPEGAILLTASTEELQQFILKYANGKGVFQQPLVLKKF